MCVCIGCVNVNHINDKPGYYTCDCVDPSDQCLADGTCVGEDECPAKDGHITLGNFKMFIDLDTNPKIILI